ncbi:V8-like Glu-specific endopeptidase [Methylophaga frappieri]|uniref:V8-like Glu-specific endopeptidase n=2 Tax=Methylophaga frappieri (strain ATCC BAA-2434 / DSM 25690 / JAM7) TaxID=754477 RepID=I1YLD5_METFJ|nr:V8-like Glu-specific endopeptidase [Methylophaga frappieri]
MKSRIIPILLVLLASACTKELRVLEVDQHEVIKSTLEAKFDGIDTALIERDYDTVDQLIASARNSLPSGENYYTGSYYVDSMKIDLFSAWSLLLQGYPIKAREMYLNAFNQFQEDEAEMVRLNKSTGEYNTQVMGALLQLQAATSSGSSILNSVYFELGNKLIDTSIEGLKNINSPELMGQKRPEHDGVRLVVVPTTNALFHVAKFKNQSGWCTASLVGYRLALTNKHCVENEQGNDVWQEGVLLFDSLRHPDSVNIKEVVRSKGDYTKETKHDWAILVLDRHPYGRGYLDVMPETSQLDSGTKIAIGGYSGDLNQGQLMSLDWGCELRKGQGIMGQHDYTCVTWGGSSGSPILLMSSIPQNPTVIGVNAAGYRVQSGAGYSRTPLDDGSKALGASSSMFYDALVRLRKLTEPEHLTELRPSE